MNERKVMKEEVEEIYPRNFGGSGRGVSSSSPLLGTTCASAYENEKIESLLENGVRNLPSGVVVSSFQSPSCYKKRKIPPSISFFDTLL